MGLRMTHLSALVAISSEEEINGREVCKRMQDASPITHLSKDAHARVDMVYSRPNVTVNEKTSHSAWVHHVLLGLRLKEAMKHLDLDCHVVAPGLEPETTYDSLEAFPIKMVKETGKN